MINTGRQTKGALQALNVKGLDATGRPFGVISVTEFGAKGDGATDDTAAIQAALTAAKDAGGGIVCLAPGNYLVTGTLTVYANTVMRGAGMFTKLTTRVPGSTLAVVGSHVVLEDFYLLGSRVGPYITGTAIYVKDTIGSSDLTNFSCHRVKIEEFTVAGIDVYKAYRGVIQETYINHVISNTGGTGYGIRLNNAYVNGYQVNGGEVRSSDVGIYVGDRCDHVTLTPIIEACKTGLQWYRCHNLMISCYFESNGVQDFEGITAPDYDTPARSITFFNCFFMNSVKTGTARYVNGLTFIGCSAPDASNGYFVVLGNAAQNVTVRNCPKVRFVDGNGKYVRVEEAGSPMQENLLTYSQSLSNAAWGKTGTITTAQDATSDGMTFLDGTAPMRLVTVGATVNTIARFTQGIGDYRGKVISIRAWVRCPAGKTGYLMPWLAVTNNIPGSAANQSGKILITDDWQEVVFTAAMPTAAEDGVVVTNVGFMFYPSDASFTDFYFHNMSVFEGSLIPAKYVATTTAVVTKRPA